MTLRAQRTQRELAPAGCDDMQRDLEVGRGKIRLGAVRPFDETDAVAFEVFFEAGFEKFFCIGEAIKIKVIYGYSRIFIRFDQGVSWALDLAGEAEAA